MNTLLANWIGILPSWSVRLIFALTVVWLATGLAVWLSRHWSAAVRHRAWGLSVVAALVLPLPVLCLPELRMGWLDAPAVRSATEDSADTEKEAESTSAAADRAVQPTSGRQPDRARGGELGVVIAPAFSSPAGAPTAALQLPESEPPRTAPVGAASPNSLPLGRLADWWLIALCAPTLWGLGHIARSLRVAGRIVDRSEEITDSICRQLLAVGVQASASADAASQSNLHPSTQIDLLSSTCENKPRLSANDEAAAARVKLRSLKAELQPAALQQLQLRQSAETPVPLCVGWRKSYIILPTDWRTWPTETLRAALAHEIAHVVRRDVAWQLLARLACAIYWFHPLAWVAAWRMRIERETACDDGVLCAGEKPTAYARALVAVAERIGTHRPVDAAVAMATRSHLELRVRGILAPNRSRLPVRPTAGRLLELATVFIVLFAAILSPFSSESLVGRALAQATEPGTTAEKKPAAPESPSEPGVVLGQVVRDDGSPVPGALVLLRDRQLFRATTDEQGRFRFEKIPHGNFLIWTHKDEQISPKERLVGKEEPGSAGGRFPNIRLTMKPGKQVRFTVLSAVTSQPLEGADIRFGYPDRRLKKTDAAGKTVEAALLPEKYEVTVEAAGHARAFREVDLTDGEQDTSQTFTLPAGGTVSGTVLDESGKTIAGAGVTYRTADVSYGYYGTAPNTDAKGEYRNPYLPLNTAIQMSVSHQDYLPQESDVTLTDKQRERQIEFRLIPRPRGGSVAGVVTGPDGKPIAGAKVTNGLHSNRERVTTTGEDGRFVLHDLHKGFTGHEIVIRARKFATLMQKVEPGPESTPTEVAVRLEPGHTLRGRLVNPTGEAIKGAYVAANGYGTEIGETVRSSEDGSFAFDSLPPGSKFMFQATGYSLVFEMELQLDGSDTVVVTLEPTVSLQGRVLDAATRQPITEYRMRGTFSQTPKPGDARGTYPNELGTGMTVQSKDGTFRINETTKGVPLEITVEAQGYLRKTFARVVAGTLEADPVKEVLLEKSDAGKPSSLAGKIVDHQTKPVAGVQVRLIVTNEPSSGEEDNRFNWTLIEVNQLGQKNYVEQYLSAVTDAEGKFEFANLLPRKFLQIAYWGKDVPKGRSLALAKSRPGEGQSTIIRMAEPATIRGSFDAKLIPNAAAFQVMFLDGAFDYKEEKLEKGKTEFRIGNLRPGRYSVVIVGEAQRDKDNPQLFFSPPLAARTLTVEAGKAYEIEYTKDDLEKKR